MASSVGVYIGNHFEVLPYNELEVGDVGDLCKGFVRGDINAETTMASSIRRRTTLELRYIRCVSP